MLTAPSSSVEQKRDLHVGGLGAASASGALAAVTEPALDLVDSWLARARDTAQAADDYVRERPWSALAVVALLGLAAGFLLSRRLP
ncbi:MAG: hypothetical protein WA642_26585 [Steroidobacteraceae bacterium]